MAWVHGVLAALSLAIGGLHLFRTARLRRGRVLEAAYAAMGLGMAAMYSPIGDPVPTAVWVSVFLLYGGWFGGLMLRARSPRVLAGEALHVVVGSAAMLFMLGADHQAGGVAGAGGQHPAHAAGAHGTVGTASAVALVFAAYFALHTLRCADRLRAARVGGPSAAAGAAPETAGPAAVPGPATTTLRAAAVAPCAASIPALAHLLMTAVMTAMLVGMI